MTATDVLLSATSGASGLVTAWVHDGAQVPMQPVGSASTALPCVVSQCAFDRVALPNCGRVNRSVGVVPQPVAETVRVHTGARVPLNAVSPMFTDQAFVQFGAVATPA